MARVATRAPVVGALARPLGLGHGLSCLEAALGLGKGILELELAFFFALPLDSFSFFPLVLGEEATA